MFKKILTVIYVCLACVFAGYSLVQPPEKFITGTDAYFWIVALIVVSIIVMFYAVLGSEDWSVIEKAIERQKD